MVAGLVSVFPGVGGMKPEIERLRQALDKAYKASQTEGAPDEMNLAEALERAGAAEDLDAAA